MFARIRGFLNRHRRKFFISGILIGSFVFLTRYTHRKLRQWQENEVLELLERSKRQQHFESTERTCTQAIMTMATTLRKAVTKTLDTEIIVQQLKNGCNDKIGTWNNLKVTAISRSTAIIYSQAMLVATLRIQLNLIGGYILKDSLHPHEPMVATEEIQRKYLSLTSYFMEDGIQKLSECIKEKVEQVSASITLQGKLDLSDIEKIYWSVVSAIIMDHKRDPIKNLSSYMIAPNFGQDEGEAFNKIKKETTDKLQSEEVQQLIQNTIASGFHVIVDHMSEYFTQNTTTKELIANNSVSIPGPSSMKDNLWINSMENSVDACHMNGLMNFNKIKMPMAKIIPILTGLVPANPTTGDVPSDWLKRLIFNDKYRTLGVNVYEAFSC